MSTFRELKFLLFEENHIKLRKYTIVSTFRKKQKEHNDYVQTLCYCGLAAAVRIFVINHSSKSFATTFQQQQQLTMSEYWIAHKLHSQLKQSQSMRYCIICKLIHWVLITQIGMYTECSNQKHTSSSRLAAHKRKGYRSTCIQWRRTGDKSREHKFGWAAGTGMVELRGSCTQQQVQAP